MASMRGKSDGHAWGIHTESQDLSDFAGPIFLHGQEDAALLGGGYAKRYPLVQIAPFYFPGNASHRGEPTLTFLRNLAKGM
jgi:hypothetical protein